MPYVKNQELGLEYFKHLGSEFLSHIEHWNFCGVKGDPASAQELADHQGRSRKHSSTTHGCRRV